MRTHLALTLLLASSAVGTPTFAATPEEAKKAAAIYQEGVGAFRTKDYETALARFEAAFALDPSPILLYNMARANEELGRPAAAVKRYEAYLEANPNASDRAEVEQRVRIMKAILANVEDGDQQALTTTTPLPTPVEPMSLRPFAYGALAAGAAMVVVGIVGAVNLESARDDFLAADTVKEKQTAEDEGSSAAITANVGWITGSLLLGAGGVLWMLEPDPVAPISAGTVPDGPSGFMLQWSTRW